MRARLCLALGSALMVAAATVPADPRPYAVAMVACAVGALWPERPRDPWEQLADDDRQREDHHR